MTQPVDHPLPGYLVAAGLLTVAVIAALTAFICDLLTPLRVGATLVPVGLLVAFVVGAVLPRLAYHLSRSFAAAALPVVVFFLAGFAPAAGGGGDVLLPGGSSAQTWISYGTILAGVIGGGISAARL